MRYKAKLFHAGKGLWEVRQRQIDFNGRKGIRGIGYFYSYNEAKKIMNNLNKPI